MASDDKARDSLFGPSAKRNINKPNPYADSNLTSTLAPVTASTPASTPASAPIPYSTSSATTTTTTADADDIARSTLLAGGKKSIPKVPIAPPTPLSPGDGALSLSNAPTQTMAMFEGDFEFDFELLGGQKSCVSIGN